MFYTCTLFLTRLTVEEDSKRFMFKLTVSTRIKGYVQFYEVSVLIAKFHEVTIWVQHKRDYLINLKVP